MKFLIEKLLRNPIDAMRDCGYRYDGSDEKTQELRFVKSFGSNPYPRFHVYGTLNKANKEFTLTLHLDQKKPVYEGSSAHAGEYEGPLVEKEMERLRINLQSGFRPPAPQIESPGL
ncbi:MAG: hypothetical protein AAB646_02630 [Patescibacteria group bacterium]